MHAAIFQTIATCLAVGIIGTGLVIALFKSF